MPISIAPHPRRPVLPSGRSWLAVLAALAAFACDTGTEEAASRAAPDPSLSPEQVVRIQLEALARNSSLNADGGIEIAYRFASPENRVSTGPIERFRELVRAPAYRAMLDHVDAEYGEGSREGRIALQAVTIVTRDGERISYLFLLSRQSGGPLDGCWLTDAVLLIEGRRPDQIAL